MLSEYEKIREQNIIEIKQAMGKTLGEISSLKQDLDIAQNASQNSLEKKKKKVKSISKDVVRRSQRVKKDVSYKDLADPCDWKNSRFGTFKTTKGKALLSGNVHDLIYKILR